MSIKRLIPALILLAASANAWAQNADGLIVKSGDSEQQFLISEVKEVTFSDAGLTVVKTDDISVEFPADWQIRFGEVAGVQSAGVSGGNAKVLIYDTEGRLVKEGTQADMDLSRLPKGVYIVKCNGKSLKIMR